jgi:hypothetical protein
MLVGERARMTVRDGRPAPSATRSLFGVGLPTTAVNIFGDRFGAVFPRFLEDRIH